jgi:hypothetical protein
MDASQLLEIVGQQVRPSEAVVVSEMTPWDSEDLLDWIENHPGTNLRVYRDIEGFIVRCIGPSGLQLTCAAQNGNAREKPSTQVASEMSHSRALADGWRRLM